LYSAVSAFVESGSELYVHQIDDVHSKHGHDLSSIHS